MKKAVNRKAGILILCGLLFALLAVIFLFFSREKRFYDDFSICPDETGAAVSLQALQQEAAALNSQRTLTEKEITLLLARASWDSGSYEVIRQQLLDEGLVMQRGDCTPDESSEVRMLPPLICYDHLEDSWYLAGGGSWTKEMTRREAGVRNHREVGSGEGVFLRLYGDGAGTGMRLMYTYFLFDSGGEVSASASGSTSGGRMMPFCSLQDRWEDGYTARSFAAVVKLDRRFAEADGRAAAGYLHTPAGTEARLPEPLDTPEGPGLCWRSSDPERTEVYWSVSTEFFSGTV